MDNEKPLVRATPIQQPLLNANVAFVTRTSDDVPSGNRGVVPGFASEADAALQEQPCTLKGISGGLAAGILGYVFGFFPSMFRHRNICLIHVWGAEGMASAKAFAVMSGIYTTVQCLCERIRQQDDGINRLIAGGASGVAVAWRSGIVGALQSGLLLAFVSWVFDFGSGSVGSAKASTIGSCAARGGCGVSLGRAVSCSLRQRNGESTAAEATAAADGDSSALGVRRLHVKLDGRWGHALQQGPATILRTPVVMWMGPIVNRAYFTPPALSMHG